MEMADPVPSTADRHAHYVSQSGHVPHIQHEPHPEHEHAADTSLANHRVISQHAHELIADSTPNPYPATEEAVHHEMSDPKVPTSPSKPKSQLLVKPPQGKTSSAPPTPLVKKIINSGTFGTGTVKATPRQSISSGVTAKAAAAPALKKSSSTPSAALASKPPMASSRAPTSATAANRRSSAVPARTSASTATKASAPSATSKPAAASATSASTRQSVVSPTGSVTSFRSSATAHRPRASVSEVKRATPTSARPASGAAAKAATTSVKVVPARASTASTAAPSGSISSIHEVREDGKDADELRNKLKDATEELVSRVQIVTDLENQIKELQVSLAEAHTEIHVKIRSIQDLEHANASMEVTFKEQLEASDRKRDELDISAAAQLTAAEEKLAALRSAVQAKEELIETLKSQTLALEDELSAAADKLEIARNAHQSATLAEHDELLKAEADLKAKIIEIDALKLAHAQAAETLEFRSNDLEKSESRIGELEAQITVLKSLREENANKVSELEVEILELKESQETLEDEREKLLVKVKSLEEHISSLVTAAKQAEEDMLSKEVEFGARLTELQSQHAEQLRSVAEDRDQITAALVSVQTQLEATQREYEQAKIDSEAAAEAHVQKLKAMEESFVLQKAELEQEIAKLLAQVEGQEAKYNSQLDAVKVEHEALLQDAFKRAKIEAGEEHVLELQSLRASSNATIEQLKAANQATIEDLKAEHSSTLESELKALEKQISGLSLELKATKDDLLKAKASLEAARSEVDALTRQRDEMLVAASATPTVAMENLEEIARLSNELSQTKDNLNALTDVLDLTKASLSELSNNHAKELEELVKARAEETTKLRAAHDADVETFAAQKLDLSVRISDLEGELATLRASISADHSSPKSNGVGVPHSPSPDSTGVTKEQLQRLHEAHNLKLYDLQTQHDKAIRVLQEELKAYQLKAEELEQEVARKAMEIQYLEQDQEENQEQITRLKEDLEAVPQLQNNDETLST